MRCGYPDVVRGIKVATPGYHFEVEYLGVVRCSFAQCLCPDRSRIRLAAQREHYICRLLVTDGLGDPCVPDWTVDYENNR